MKIQEAIISKLEAAFAPVFLDVVNESGNHNVPPGSESHFKVTLVSGAFDGVRSVARHQKVYKALAEEMAGSVHALALHTYTEPEWVEKGGAPNSPDCLGGSGK